MAGCYQKTPWIDVESVAPHPISLISDLRWLHKEIDPKQVQPGPLGRQRYKALAQGKGWEGEAGRGLLGQREVSFPQTRELGSTGMRCQRFTSCAPLGESEGSMETHQHPSSHGESVVRWLADLSMGPQTHSHKSGGRSQVVQ